MFMRSKGAFENNIQSLPSSQHILSEIMDLLNDPSITPKKLSQIINRDQSTVVKILAIANSPAYGFSRKVSTVEMAISLLGMEVIKDLLISFSLLNISNNKNSKFFSQSEFNKHSLLTGLISQILAHDFNYVAKNEAFVAGLLHDIGIAVINSYMSDEFRLICEIKFYRRINQTKAEELILGKNHSQIGGAVLENWNFPDNLVDAVKNHHTPSKSEKNPKLSAIVHIADYITSFIQSPFLLNEELEEIDLAVLEILNIPDESFLSELINNVSLIVKSNFKDVMGK